MNAQKFSFGRDFQIGILALMMQRFEFLLMAVELVPADSFEDKILIWFFNTTKEYYTQHKEAPSRSVIENELLKACKTKIFKENEIDEYFKVSEKLWETVQSQNYVVNEVIRFCRRQACRKAYLETAPLMDSAGEDEWDQIVDKITDARNIGLNYLEDGHWYFKEVRARCNRRLNNMAVKQSHTGISGYNPTFKVKVNLDDILGGGLNQGQLGIWMGKSGGGKSIALCHIGKRAVIQGQKVIHYTLELDEDQIASRYDANWADVDHRKLVKNTAKVVSEIERLGTLQGYEDRLIIQFFPTGSVTVNAIRSHLRQLASVGWLPDVIIVDYIDLLKPTTNYKDQYQDLGVISQDLRGLAGELEVPMWTASQVNRPGYNLEVVDLDHMGDSMQKAYIADVVLAICADRDEKQKGIMRINVAKNRNGPDKIQVGIRTDFPKMSLYKESADATDWPSPSAKKKANTNIPEEDQAPGLPDKNVHEEDK